MSSISVLTFAQTGKEEYDSSVKADMEAAFGLRYAIASVFQGLRADLREFVTSLRAKVIN